MGQDVSCRGSSCRGSCSSSCSNHSSPKTDLNGRRPQPDVKSFPFKSYPDCEEEDDTKLYEEAVEDDQIGHFLPRGCFCEKHSKHAFGPVTVVPQTEVQLHDLFGEASAKCHQCEDYVEETCPAKQAVSSAKTALCAESDGTKNASRLADQSDVPAKVIPSLSSAKSCSERRATSEEERRVPSFSDISGKSGPVRKAPAPLEDIHEGPVVTFEELIEVTPEKIGSIGGCNSSGEASAWVRSSHYESTACSWSDSESSIPSAMPSLKSEHERAVAAFLKENGFSTNLRRWKRQRFSMTFPLHVAASQGLVRMTELLLKAMADPKQRNSWGQTAMDVARKNCKRDTHRQVLEILESWMCTEKCPHEGNSGQSKNTSSS